MQDPCHSSENRGLGAARNSGIRISTGELIGFVDSDDWLEPTMYEVLYRSLTKENADTSMITGVLEYLTDDKYIFIILIYIW